jgi:CHAD domain-containing protein
LRIEIGRAGGLYNSERLHAVRVAAKKLRYAMEVDRELTRSRAMARINRLKNLQDALGEIHDYEILLEHTREVQIALAGVDRRAATELDGLVRTLETACRDGHAVFLRDRAGIQALCHQIIEAARQGRPTFL